MLENIVEKNAVLQLFGSLLLKRSIEVYLRSALSQLLSTNNPKISSALWLTSGLVHLLPPKLSKKVAGCLFKRTDYWLEISKNVYSDTVTFFTSAVVQLNCRTVHRQRHGVRNVFDKATHYALK